jgi:hypothetical protein
MVLHRDPLLASVAACCISDVGMRYATDGFALRLCGLELPWSRRLYRLRLRGHGAMCSLHDCQLQLGGLLGRAVRRGLPVRVPAGLSDALAVSSSVVFSSPCAAPRFPHLAGVTHFLIDDLPAGLHGLACSREGSPAAVQRLRGRRFSFLTTGYPVRRGIRLVVKERSGRSVRLDGLTISQCLMSCK